MVFYSILAEILARAVSHLGLGSVALRHRLRTCSPASNIALNADFAYPVVSIEVRSTNFNGERTLMIEYQLQLLHVYLSFPAKLLIFCE